MTASDLIECREAYASLRLPTLAAGYPLPAELTAPQNFSCFPSLLKRQDCTFREPYLTLSTNLMAFYLLGDGSRLSYLLISLAAAAPLLYAFPSRFSPLSGPHFNHTFMNQSSPPLTGSPPPVIFLTSLPSPHDLAL